MHDPAKGLLRIPLPRTQVNNANPSVRIHQNPKKGCGMAEKGNRSPPIAGTLSYRSEMGGIGGSSPKACEFLL